MKNLVIFADYGVDDAAATASLFAHRERFGDISIVPIGGNVPVDMSYRNCLTLLHTLGVRPTRVVDVRAVPQPCEYLPVIHGTDGMGDIFTPCEDADGLTVCSLDALLDAMQGDEVLLSLGPATLVAQTLRRHPGCEVVLMGGCVDEEPNFNGYEFNHALDPEAFAYCTAHPHVAVTLDTCRIPVLDIRTADIAGDGPYAAILRADQVLSVQREEDGCYVWDDVAACYLLHPERFVTDVCTDLWGNVLTQARYVSPLRHFAAD